VKEKSKPKVYWNEIGWIMLGIMVLGVLLGTLAWRQLVSTYPQVKVSMSGSENYNRPVPREYVYYKLGEYHIALPWEGLNRQLRLVGGREVYSLRGGPEGFSIIIPPPAQRKDPEHGLHEGMHQPDQSTLQDKTGEDALQILRQSFSPGLHWTMLRRQELLPDGTVWVKEVSTPGFTGFRIQVVKGGVTASHFHLFDDKLWHSLVITSREGTTSGVPDTAAMLSSFHFRCTEVH